VGAATERIGRLAFGALVMVIALRVSPASADPSTTPAPSPPATPSPSSDPCLQIGSLVSRPTISTSPCSVKAGDVLIETGYSNTSTSGPGGSHTLLYPQAAVRVGLPGKLEFDLDPSSFTRESGTPATSGTTDAMLGLHYEFGYTGNLVYAVNALYTLNTGTPAFSGNGDGERLNVEAAYTLSPALGLFSTLGYATQSAGTVSVPARVRTFAPSLGLTLTLPKGFDVLGEGFGTTSNAPGEGGSYAVDVAAQKTIGSRVLLDANFFAYPPAQGNSHQTVAGFGASYLLGP